MCKNYLTHVKESSEIDGPLEAGGAFSAEIWEVGIDFED